MNSGLITSELTENERQKKVTVKWSYPKLLATNWYSDDLKGKGLYYISRKFGRKETLLYIGQTFDSYYNRLIAHDWNWLGLYRGKKYFRLGSIIYPSNRSDEEMKQLLKDVESALIFGTAPTPKENSKSTISYTPKHLYIITNEGYRGELLETIAMREHIPN